MRWWDEQVVPRATDLLLNAGEIHKLRKRTCEGLTGHVLEIGFGSGLNAQHYPAAVDRVSAVDPSSVAWDLALHKHLAGIGARVVRAGLDGESIDLPDGSVDSALSTFSLCTIPHVDAALREVARVLRSGGTFHFLEHGLAPDPRVATWQGRLTPIQRRVGAGCRLDRPIADLVAASGLDISEMERFYLSGPKVLGHVYLGRAVRS